MIKFLGDVHLGKAFKNGVPLHRRGDRARIQWAEFEANLNDVEGIKLHVQVGDLFDEAVVPYGVIYRAARAYRAAAAANPDTCYALLQGNHDANRDVEKVTAFMMFKEMVGEAVLIADREPLAIEQDDQKVLLVPWHPVITAEEMVAQNESMFTWADTVVGHWDVVMGGTNQIPSAALAALGVKRAVTGHDHNARDLELDGLDITLTGSMQPYSHSEDRNEQFYVTRTLDQVLAAPDSFADKHLRVTLVGDEQLDVPIDCLQLSLSRNGAEQEATGIEVDFEVFEMKTLFDQAMDMAGVNPARTADVWGRMQDAQMGAE